MKHIKLQRTESKIKCVRAVIVVWSFFIFLTAAALLVQDKFVDVKMAKASEQRLVLQNKRLPRPRNDVSPALDSADPIAMTKWEEFKLAAKKVSKIYNFPVNVVLAQGALESAHGRSNFCKQRNNCLGIGAFDSNPDNAYQFENMEQSVIAYMQLIKKNFPEAWANRKNADAVILKLKLNSSGLVYATDPNYVQKVKAMPEYK